MRVWSGGRTGPSAGLCCRFSSRACGAKRSTRCAAANAGASCAKSRVADDPVVARRNRRHRSHRSRRVAARARNAARRAARRHQPRVLTAAHLARGRATNRRPARHRQEPSRRRPAAFTPSPFPEARTDPTHLDDDAELYALGPTEPRTRRRDREPSRDLRRLPRRFVAAEAAAASLAAALPPMPAASSRRGDTWWAPLLRHRGERSCSQQPLRSKAITAHSAQSQIAP